MRELALQPPGCDRYFNCGCSSLPLQLPITMPYPRLYLPATLNVDARLELSPEQRRHLTTVLRLRPGAAFNVFDQDGQEFAAQLESSTYIRVTARLEEYRESPLRVSVGQAWARGARMDYVVQKCTELGVHEIYLLSSERSAKVNNVAAASKLAHLQKVATHAAEQCWRQRVPTIHPLTTMSDWLRSCRAEVKLVMHERSSARLALEPRPGSVALLAGPEGGFSSAEIAAAEAAGFACWRLGPRVLRAETAAASGLSVLQYLHGDLHHF